ncbi:hypothetical protein OOZ15_08885 [Galbibacter sp. EGI 63066]|uniref:hypothetical protein n=1 Tax=Galbibacter sp. EGI 63066 TaxID=2993559 RepID=UPI0022490C18|nr:hypothetical protein [Galbibacter sp. EGI 63066]MCX2680050.1 hypothetical protein [Galbibacter sp. EGI 63066]
MKKIEIQKRNEITLKTDDIIKTATLSAPNELVMLMSSGDVVRHKIKEEETETLFTIASKHVVYSDGGFDINAPSTLYTLDDIVVVVNDYKCHGYIHYPGKYHLMHIFRKDYHARASKFPIALYKNESGIPHMIYAVGWNHLQIMNLDTRMLLTATKSLIEVDAEEKHWDVYGAENFSDMNPWPRTYDYFYGRLEMSPDKQHFLSAGWIWGSFDLYNVYNVHNFINNNRISYKDVYAGEHCDRPVCWVSNNTVAVGHFDYDENKKKWHDEIHFYKIDDKESEFVRKIKVEGFELSKSEIYFCKALNAIVLVGDEKGLAIFSLNGEIWFHDKEIEIDTYNPDLNLCLQWEDKTVKVYQIEAFT